VMLPFESAYRGSLEGSRGGRVSSRRHAGRGSRGPRYTTIRDANGLDRSSKLVTVLLPRLIAGSPGRPARRRWLPGVCHDVLIAQGHRRRGVIHARHQLPGRRPGGRRQRRGRVPKVMEAQPLQVELLHRRPPHQPIEVAALQVSAPATREHQPIRLRRDRAGEVCVVSGDT
jgi:hypothetical protein